MNCIEIKANDFDYIAKKEDVDIVVLKNGKKWVCIKNYAITDLNNGFYRLNLANRRVKNDKN